MNNDLFREYPMTILLSIIVIIAAVGGIIVVIANPSTLTFDRYLGLMQPFALAVAGLGGAKALKKGLIGQSTGVEPVTPPVAADLPPEGDYADDDTEVLTPDLNADGSHPAGDYDPASAALPEGVPKSGDV